MLLCALHSAGGIHGATTFTTALGDRQSCYSHFPDEDTEAQ